MLLNDTRFSSDGISVISHLLTRLNPSSSENLLLAISDLTPLKMGLGETSIKYMSLVHGISQFPRGVSTEKIIPIFSIKILDPDRYPGVKR